MSVAVVAEAKRELEAVGVDLSGPCGAFAITNRSAMKLGLGVLDKPSGSNCSGYATDIVMARNGRIWDCLIDSGGANIPAWNEGEPVEASRYRDPVGTTPLPPVPPNPPTPPVDLTPVLVKLEQMEEANEQRFQALLAIIRGIEAPNYTGTMVASGKRITLRPVS